MLKCLLFACLLGVSVRCDEGQREVVLFHKADENKDDMLSRVELDHIFLQFDTNNDTKITPAEFVKDWTTVYNLGSADEANTLFTRADSNDDGFLDAQDVPAVFTFFDMNGDGAVDISEFLTQWGTLTLIPSGHVDVSVDVNQTSIVG